MEQSANEASRTSPSVAARTRGSHSELNSISRSMLLANQSRSRSRDSSQSRRDMVVDITGARLDVEAGVLAVSRRRTNPCD